MHFLRTSVLTGLLGALISCAAPQDHGSASLPATQQSHTLPSSIELRRQSCPAGTTYASPNKFTIRSEPVPLANRPSQAALPPGVRFAGGWSLTSPHAEFGGLSGVELLPDGRLLTVSDVGAFIWIGMANGAPDGTGEISYMKGPNGQILRGKRDGDSEGLALADGLAFVSFERRHRVAAFDLETCGASARAAPVTELPSELSGIRIKENSGAEALSAGKVMVAGYEQLIDGYSPLVSVSKGGSSTELLAPAKRDYNGPLVGMTNTIMLGDAATAGSVVYSLRRSYNPVFGNRLTVEAAYEDAGGASRRALFELKPPMNVDNFEGITAETLSDGTHRLWLVSDNNFSDQQRTLLFAFDLIGEAH